MADPKREWGLQAMAEARMKTHGWCPRDIFLAKQCLTGLPMYCASYVCRNLNQERKDHSECSELQCAANQIDNSTYKTRHRSPDCQCEHWGPDALKLAAKVRMNQIPQILMQRTKRPDGSKSVEFDLGGARSGEISAVISHVWSDGVHNPHYARL